MADLETELIEAGLDQVLGQARRLTGIDCDLVNLATNDKVGRSPQGLGDVLGDPGRSRLPWLTPSTRIVIVSRALT